MDISMERWYEASSKRFSVRHYKGVPDEDEIESLREFAADISTDAVRVEIAKNEKVFSPRLFGSNKIKGAQYFAAFISEEGRTLEVGYIGEIFVLECVARGFGTCWLGASFRMGQAQSCVNLSGEEGIVCITPIGIPNEAFTLRPRKTMSTLTGLTVQEFMRLPRYMQSAFECARRAPSALNTQPWEFRTQGDGFSIAKVSSNLGYGELDTGIAMLHAEIGAAHHCVTGDWDLDDEEFTFIPYREQPVPDKENAAESADKDTNSIDEQTSLPQM